MTQEVEGQDKWETIKILRTEKDEIDAFIKKNPRFSNQTDFVRYAIKKELDRQTGGRKN